MSAAKQFLLIIVDVAAAIESWSDYFNFRWEVNFHCDQDRYEHITEDWSQSFYSAQVYHIVKDFKNDKKNIYNVNLKQTQDNQNSDSDQK